MGRVSGRKSIEKEADSRLAVSSCVLVGTTCPSVSPLEPDTPWRTHHFHWYASSIVPKRPHSAGTLGAHFFVALNQPVHLMLNVPFTPQAATPNPLFHAMPSIYVPGPVCCGQTRVLLCPGPQIAVPQFAQRPGGAISFPYLHEGALGTNYC